MARLARKRIFIYKQYQFNKNFECFYCGCAKDCQDHYPPLSCAFAEDEKILVNSCFDCNRLLGDSYQETFEGRFIFLKELLHSNLKKILYRYKFWTNAEIIDTALEGRLKLEIEKISYQKSKAISRLLHGLSKERDAEFYGRVVYLRKIIFLTDIQFLELLNLENKIYK